MPNNITGLEDGTYADPVGVNSTALLQGKGKSGAPISSAESKNFWGMWTQSTATGDNRGLYWRQYFKGTGGGEVIRAWANVNVSGAAAGATVNGIHTTLSVDASCSVSGAGNAIRATLSGAADTRTLGGTCAALQLDSDIGANNTVPKTWTFIRVTDSNSVKVNYLLNMPTIASGGILAAHTTDAITHSIRCVDANGTVFYLMATTTATNRTGGA